MRVAIQSGSDRSSTRGAIPISRVSSECTWVVLAYGRRCAANAASTRIQDRIVLLRSRRGNPLDGYPERKETTASNGSKRWLTVFFTESRWRLQPRQCAIRNRGWGGMYCHWKHAGGGIWTRHGLVMASDSRTNAGHDQVNVAHKMHLFEQPGERVFILLSSGSLSCAQSIVRQLRRDFDQAKGLAQAPSLYDAARIIGEEVRRVSDRAD
jgi:hypothetical protein